MRRVAQPLLAALIALAGALVLAVLPRSTGPGPLLPPPDRIVGGVPIRVGQAVSFGVDIPRYSGPGTIVLDSISPVDPTPGLHVLGSRVLVAGENDGVGLAGRRGPFPPDGLVLHPLAGWRYRAADGLVQVVVGLRPGGRGEFGARGWTLRYHIGHRAYVATFPQSFWVCAPMRTYVRSCGPRPTSPG